MEKTEITEENAQGAETRKTLTEEQFRKMVIKDLSTCYHFMHAIASDPNTMNALSEYLYGTYLNKLHKAETDAQLKMGI